MRESAKTEIKRDKMRDRKDNDKISTNTQCVFVLILSLSFLSLFILSVSLSLSPICHMDNGRQTDTDGWTAKRMVCMILVQNQNQFTTAGAIYLYSVAQEREIEGVLC